MYRYKTIEMFIQLYQRICSRSYIYEYLFELQQYVQIIANKQKISGKTCNAFAIN